MAAYVQVVLQETLRNVGASGALVKVRPGFARNFLVPRGLAAYATDKNVARIEHEKREAIARATKLRGEAEGLAKKISEVTLKIARPFGSEDRMYGSVTAKDIGGRNRFGVNRPRSRASLQLACEYRLHIVRAAAQHGVSRRQHLRLVVQQDRLLHPAQIDTTIQPPKVPRDGHRQ